MATLGEEVKNPEKVLPRVIVITLLGVLALYAAIALVTLGLVGPDRLARSEAPLVEIAPEALAPVGGGCCGAGITGIFGRHLGWSLQDLDGDGSGGGPTARARCGVEEDRLACGCGAGDGAGSECRGHRC